MHARLASWSAILDTFWHRFLPCPCRLFVSTVSVLTKLNVTGVPLEKRGRGWVLPWSTARPAKGRAIGCRDSSQISEARWDGMGWDGIGTGDHYLEQQLAFFFAVTPAVELVPTAQR